MNIGLLIVPAIAGYWLLDQTYLWRYQLRRESGYRLFFKSAIAGLVLVAIARLLCVTLECAFPDSLDEAFRYIEAWKRYAPFEYSGTMMLTAALAVVTPPILNRFLDADRLAKSASLTNGDLVEWAIQDSLDHQTLVEISMKTGKSYIGLATRSGVSTSGPTDVALIPLASGYRDKETQVLKTTTYYTDTLSEYKGDRGDFQVVVPRSEIASVRKFMPGVWQAEARQ